jgi:hypothetical protein
MICITKYRFIVLLNFDMRSRKITVEKKIKKLTHIILFTLSEFPKLLNRSCASPKTYPTDLMHYMSQEG